MSYNVHQLGSHLDPLPCKPLHTRSVVREDHSAGPGNPNKRSCINRVHGREHRHVALAPLFLGGYGYAASRTKLMHVLHWPLICSSP
jgi:hypothetical protein